MLDGTKTAEHNVDSFFKPEIAARFDGKVYIDRMNLVTTNMPVIARLSLSMMPSDRISFIKAITVKYFF